MMSRLRPRTIVFARCVFPSEAAHHAPGQLVGGVHTLVAGVVQVYHRLHVVEEEEKGRKVDQEVERENQGGETAHTWMAMEMT